MNKKMTSYSERLKQLAGISKNKNKKYLDESFCTREELLASNDDQTNIYEKELELEENDSINNEVEEIESLINRADMLYPGSKFYGMYAGENMMEEDQSIESLDEN